VSQRYEITKAIRNGEQLYACLDCGRVWTEKTILTPIEYPVPSWIKERQLLSHGVCVNFIKKYDARRGEKDG